MMVDPFGDQQPSLTDRGFRMVDTVERGASLESSNVVGADLPQFRVGRDHGSFAASADRGIQHYASSLRMIRNVRILGHRRCLAQEPRSSLPRVSTGSRCYFGFAINP